MRRPRALVALVALALLTPLAPAAAAAQLEPPATGGAAAIEQAFGMLGHYRRVLLIGAHPDDEDTELLTVLVRGMGAEAGYLSLNRGEGGQNLIGPELGDALGLLRTEELLAARRLDGAGQYFTRAYDFGYSKSLDETWTHWPPDTVLKDVVRVVRRFRPQVIVSIFSGTPQDGHGQHQAAGWAAREAFEAAGDPTRFPELQREELLRPWVPLKLYRSTRFDSAATTLTLEGGVLDPAVGKSYHQIAMAGRSLHRSQDMGRLQTIGPSEVRIALLEDRTGEGEGGIFAGVDTTLGAMPWVERPGSGARARRARFAARVDSAHRAYRAGEWRRVSELTRRAEADLLAPAPDDGEAGVTPLVFATPEQSDQRRHLATVRTAVAGLVGDALADDDRVVAGQRIEVTLLTWNAGSHRLPVRTALESAEGWDAAPDTAAPSGPLEPGEVARRVRQVAVPADAPPSTPYFLRRPRVGDLYDWTDARPRVRGEPFEPPPLVARFEGPAPWPELAREVTARFNDQARGEVRRPVTVVPRIDVKLDPGTELWSTLAPRPRRLTVTLTHGARDTTAGRVELELPGGWRPAPPRPFRLTREGERRTFDFEVTPPARLGGDSLELRAVAVGPGNERFDVGVFTVEYPHIRPRSYVRRAAALIRAAPLALPRLRRVGYVRGAADRVPEALRSVGVPLVVLDADALARGDLGRYDAIVVGPRAYETDSALVEHNDRLLAYARRGGLVVVQYQQEQFFTGGFAPYPLTVGGPPLLLTGAGAPGGTAGRGTGRPVSHDRVTDEAAPVRALAPAHPALRAPNAIAEADWAGWVQERGLYFARSWDAAYQPLVETADPGEVPHAGGLLVARVGRGTYVYTGLSFFRQLPAAVPGAFRLFANLLALRHGRARR